MRLVETFTQDIVPNWVLLIVLGCVVIALPSLYRLRSRVNLETQFV